MIITPQETYEKFKRFSEKRVELKCDMCGKVTSTSYNNYLSKVEKTGSKETFCQPCSTKISGKLKRGKTIKGAPKPKGEHSKSWKGGRFISSDGYWMVYTGSVDQKVKWNNYRKEHLIVAEKKIERKLNKGEVVHHIDGDKLNNNPENLEVLDSEVLHRKIHNQAQKLFFELVKLGIVSYDKETKTYVAMGKLRELLEHPEEDNQQPSLSSNAFEGSETRG